MRYDYLIGIGINMEKRASSDCMKDFPPGRPFRLRADRYGPGHARIYTGTTPR